MTGDLSPPTCDHCGAGMPTRKVRYCDACVREGLPGPQHIGAVMKGVVVTAARNAVAYWKRRATAPDAPALERMEALAQLEYFKEQYRALTGGDHYDAT